MPPLEFSVWPERGGAMGARIRAADWAATSLGVADRWPQCLKTTIEILLCAPMPMVLLWGAESFLFVNDAFTELTDELTVASCSTVRDDWSLGGLLDAARVRGALAGTAHADPQQQVLLHRHGLAVFARLSISYTPVHDERGAQAGALVILSEAASHTERATAGEALRAEAAIRASETKYRTLFDSIDEGFCIVQMLFDDQDRPVDYRFLEVNRAFERQTGIAAAQGRRMRDLVPQHEEHWFAIYGAVAVSGEAVRFINRADQLHRVFDVYAFRVGDPAARTVALLFTDITARAQAENALRQSEAKFVKAFQSSPAALLISRLADGRFLDVNDAYCAILGYRREELLGRLTTEFNIFIHAADRQAIVKRLLTSGSIRAFETSIRHRSGAIRHVIADQDVMTFNGEPCILTHFLDITERKQLEAALHTAFQRFQVILASLYGGILVLRDDDQVEFANQALCDLFDLADRPDALIGLHESDLVPRFAGIYVDATAALARIRALVAEGQPVRGEEIAMTNGRTYLRDFIPIVIDGNQYGRVWHHLDITAQKQAEMALAAEQALLAQRVAERTAELRITNDELVRAARVKDEFLSNMSHELRTPLNAILGRSELLREQIYGALTPRQESAVQSIAEAGQHLLSLINDILDLSKMEAGKLALQLAPLDVEAAGRAAVRMVLQQAAAKQIALTTIYDARAEMIVADERRLKQILVNLLSNAVKFTPAGGKVGLEVRADPERQAVIFTVWDTGIGIAPEDQARLFQPFVQIDSSLSRQYDGTGLGLALVLRLTDLHGGSVALESSLGQGSSFSITLPWIVPSAQPAAEPMRIGQAPPSAPWAPSVVRQPGAPGPLVLLVDDNETNLQVLVDYLSPAGYAVVVARNGAEAVALAEERRPALIVMDIQMPVLDGLEAMRRIRAAGLRDTPMIALTALAMPGDRERCLAAGANDYLARPVRLGALLSLIAAQLEDAPRRE